MSIVPALDLRPEPAKEPPLVSVGPATAGGPDMLTIRGLPSNIELEQALLGALLYDNGAFDQIRDDLTAAHFHEPFHGRMFEAFRHLLRQGRLVEPIMLADYFRTDPVFQDLGGFRYFADLVDRAPPPANAASYADSVRDVGIRRELVKLAGEIALDATEGDVKRSANDMVEAVEARLYDLVEPGGASRGFGGGFVDFGEALRGAVEMAAEAYSRDGGLAGISTGLMDLDQKLGGLHPSDLVIIAGRPSMGKTALACNIAFHVANTYAYESQPDGTRKTTSGGVVAFFSLEMSAEQLATRLLAERSGVSGDRLRKGEIDASEFGRVRDAAIEIESAPLHIDATGGLAMGKLAARARRLKRQHGLDLIVVDYLQLITGGGDERSRENRVQEVSAITAALKALAKELNVPVIALSQLSRKVEEREDKRPMLSDLRESGSIEQDADMVMFVYREEYYVGRAEPDQGNDAKRLEWQERMDACRGLAEVIVGKQRHGPIGTVRLHFDEDLTKFGNLAREGRGRRP